MKTPTSALFCGGPADGRVWDVFDAPPYYDVPILKSPSVPLVYTEAYSKTMGTSIAIYGYKRHTVLSSDRRRSAVVYVCRSIPEDQLMGWLRYHKSGQMLLEELG